MCVRHIIGRGRGRVYYLLWPRGEENSLTFSYIKSECPGQPRGGGLGFKWLDWCGDPFFKSYKNDKRNSKWWENEKRNSYPFFKVMWKRKTKTEIDIRFSKLGENEKQKAKFKSVFQCHAKTKNGNGTWIPFSHAIEKRLALRYTHFLSSNLRHKFDLIF